VYYFNTATTGKPNAVNHYFVSMFFILYQNRHERHQLTMLSHLRVRVRIIVRLSRQRLRVTPSQLRLHPHLSRLKNGN
jgi:hypothetical protein